MLTDSERQAAERIHASLAAKVKSIRADPGLSPLGRRAELARSALHARQQLTALRGQADARRATERAAAERALFRGTAASLIADRDARSYAAGLATAADARRELAAAERAGDESLARAIFARCFDMAGPNDLGAHWAATADAYLSSRPAAAEAAAQLMELSDSTRTAIMDGALLRANLPEEVRGGTLEGHISAGEPQNGAA